MHVKPLCNLSHFAGGGHSDSDGHGDGGGGGGLDLGYLLAVCTLLQVTSDW